MTSRISYWVKWKENIKRRNWTFILCFVTMIFALPVATLLLLNNINSQLRSGAELTPERIDRIMTEMHNYLASQTGFSEWMPLALGFFAILFSVQGFSFLYSRRKMDLYMSVPVSAVKRYIMICANGIIVFGASYLFSLILTWVVGYSFNVMTGAIMLQSVAAFLVNMISFIAIYQMALVAVMLCGNMMTALLGCSVLFLYEAAMKYLFTGLKSVFFTNYCYKDEARLFDLPWLTPFCGHFSFSVDTWYSDGILNVSSDSWFAEAGSLGGIMLLEAAVFGMIAFMLFRRRKTESYTKAIAFGAMKPILELLLLIPFAAAVGVLTGQMASDMKVFMFAGTVVATLIGHAIIRIIYERDLRAVLQKKALVLVSLAASVGILCVFRFDLTGYDSYVPKAEELESISVSLEHDYHQFGRYAVPFESGDYRDVSSELLEKMNSSDPETIQAVLSMVQTWIDTEDAMKETNTTEEAAIETSRRAMLGENGTIDGSWMVVRYKLKSGREVYRRFYMSSKATPEELDALMMDESWRKIRYQIYEEAFVEAINGMKIEYYDGKQNQLYTLDQKKLLEDYKKDFADYNYSAITSDMPCGMIRFTLPRDNNLGNCTWTYPVYRDYENTIRLLEENNIAVIDSEAFLAAEDVKDITVTYYHYEDRKDGLFENGEIEEQEITITIDDADEIEALLESLYPESLTNVAGEEFHRFYYDDYAVSVTLSESARKNRYSLSAVIIPEGKTPSFVKEKIVEAAVR